MSGGQSPRMNESVQARMLLTAPARHEDDEGNEAQVEVNLVAVVVATCLEVTQIRSVPIIPTALAKSLTSVSSHLRQGTKTG